MFPTLNSQDKGTDVKNKPHDLSSSDISPEPLKMLQMTTFIKFLIFSTTPTSHNIHAQSTLAHVAKVVQLVQPQGHCTSYGV